MLTEGLALMAQASLPCRACLVNTSLTGCRNSARGARPGKSTRQILRHCSMIPLKLSGTFVNALTQLCRANGGNSCLPCHCSSQSISVTRRRGVTNRCCAILCGNRAADCSRLIRISGRLGQVLGAVRIGRIYPGFQTNGIVIRSRSYGNIPSRKRR